MDELRKRQKIISQLVEARLEQGISQAELARRLGIQRSGINRLESGTQNPTLDMILKIASALGKDVSLELNDKEEPMSHVYSLRIYDTELMRFSMEKQGLSGLVARSTTAIGWCQKDLRGSSPNTIFTKIAFLRYWRWWPIPAQAGAGRRLPHPRS